MRRLTTPTPEKERGPSNFAPLQAVAAGDATAETKMNENFAPVTLFAEDVTKELDKGLTAEREAKLAYVVGALGGLNIVLYGPTGVGKTVLLEEARRLYKGLDEDDVSEIPPQADLTGKEVTGGIIRSSKEITENGHSRTETTETSITGILRPNTRILHGDEINRANPLAVGAMLNGIERREVTVGNDKVRVPDLEYSIVALNPGTTDHSVFELPAALVSRWALGAPMGVDPTTEDEILERTLSRTLSQPEQMQTVIHIDELRKLRALGRTTIVSPDNQENFKSIIRDVQGHLRDNGLNEGLGRAGEQMIQVASMLAAIAGRAYISRADLLQAARFNLFAKLGPTDKGNPQEAINDVVENSRAKDEEREKWHISREYRTS